jgi:hypothetical protein
MSTNWQKEGLINGLAAGGLTILFILLLHTIDRAWGANRWVIYATFGIYLVFMYRAGRHESGENLLMYARPVLLCWIVANLLYYPFFFWFVTYYDPGLVAIQAADMQAAGYGEITAEEMRITAGGTLRMFLYSIFPGMILTILVSMVLRAR